MTLDLGRSNSWQYIPKYNHSWGHRYNQQMVKMATMLHGSVKSIVTVLPGGPAVNDTYLDLTDGKIYVWQPAVDDPNDDSGPAQWYTITPVVGDRLYVEDENMMYVLNSSNAWVVFWNPAQSHRAIARELTFYVPDIIRPTTDIIRYVASFEMAFPEDAEGSGAYAQTPPTDTVVFTLRRNNVQFGTITFTVGDSEGVVAIPAETVIVPTINEGQYTQANSFTVRSPANLRGMKDLSVSLRTKIRSID